MISALVPGASGPGSVLCSWARHLTLTMPISTQEYKWAGMTCCGPASRPRVVEILLARLLFCFFFVQYAYLLPGVYVVCTIDNLWKYFPYELEL